MRIIICGAGEVGTHAAEVLAGAGHGITMIDADEDRLRLVADTMDVSTLHGNCALAEVLREARVGSADLLVASTDSDEINLLTASVARGMGAARTVARVHRGAFFENRGLDYREHLGIDQLICPEFSTATAIARTLRNPAALAIEHFARGTVEMQAVTVSSGASATGKPLSQLRLPSGTRLAAITRGDQVFIPDAETEVQEGDRIVLVGNSDVFYDTRKMFHKGDAGRQRVVIMGGGNITVWLCRALKERNWSIRVFETNRAHAEELAERLEWVTVIQADPTDRDVFQEENLAQADVFISVLDDDEANIIGCVLAKTSGVTQTMAVVQRSTYLDLLYLIGVDRSFSPRVVAAQEIENLLDDRPLRLLASLADGVVDVYRVRADPKSPLIGPPLRDIKLGHDWMIAALRRNGRVWVPTADDAIEPHDTVLVIGKHGGEQQLEKMFHI